MKIKTEPQQLRRNTEDLGGGLGGNASLWGSFTRVVGIPFGSYGPMGAVLFLWDPGVSVWLEWLVGGRECGGRPAEPEHIRGLGADRPGTLQGCWGPCHDVI